ncbi:hypothetical protein PoMZ_02328 [Pyricularia oryzae]|uniref:Uncharacterized protein n=1 Tax=Pyricularia oryzae TaxID=318829 RepID=A0A4P7NB32_PYROR|nr:hypothetical protein PoMZ_02328 [Pyricularia oryzae]
MALHPSYRRQLSKLREGYLGSFFYQIDTLKISCPDTLSSLRVVFHINGFNYTTELSKNRAYAKPEQKINNERL